MYRVQSGIPFQIGLNPSFCNVPPQFIQFCSPALLPGANPFLQSPSHFDPTKPVLNVQAFEPKESFQFYTGQGPRVQNFRQPGYSDFDIGLEKTVHITERFTFQLRGDAFNVFNAHHFNSVGAFIQSSGLGGSSFTTDIASQDFGWNGGVTRGETFRCRAVSRSRFDWRRSFYSTRIYISFAHQMLSGK